MTTPIEDSRLIVKLANIHRIDTRESSRQWWSMACGRRSLLVLFCSCSRSLTLARKSTPAMILGSVTSSAFPTSCNTASFSFKVADRTRYRATTASSIPHALHPHLPTSRPRGRIGGKSTSKHAEASYLKKTFPSSCRTW
jgi:hypothetical protein